mgnify:CR=1 FL=1
MMYECADGETTRSFCSVRVTNPRILCTCSTDYDEDYTKFYQNWYTEESLFLRDYLYSYRCSAIDFSGTYVSPSFLMAYLRGEEDTVAEMSGLAEFDMLPVDAPVCVHS